MTGRDMVFSEAEMLLIRVTGTLVLLFGKQRMRYLVSSFTECRVSSSSRHPSCPQRTNVKNSIPRTSLGFLKASTMPTSVKLFMTTEEVNDKLQLRTHWEGPYIFTINYLSWLSSLLWMHVVHGSTVVTPTLHSLPSYSVCSVVQYISFIQFTN